MVRSKVKLVTTMLIVALTGGIASGKTTVSNAFSELGVPIVDADIVARIVVSPGSNSLNQLKALFGSEIIQENGELDRAALKHIIFSDDVKKKQVEGILHPAIAAYSQKMIKQYEAENHAYCLHVIPLLIETKQAERFKHILLVDTPVETQLTRLLQRDNLSEAEAWRIINSQASREQRQSVATEIILNDGNIKRLQSDVLSLHKKFQDLSGEHQA